MSECKTQLTSFGWGESWNRCLCCDLKCWGPSDDDPWKAMDFLSWHLASPCWALGAETDFTHGLFQQALSSDAVLLTLEYTPKPVVAVGGFLKNVFK